MKKLLCLLMCAFALSFVAAKPFEGKYTAESAVFYLVHNGGALTIDVTIQKENKGYDGNPILKTTPEDLLLVYDPDEKQVEMKYWRLEDSTGEQHYTFTYQDAKAGVWQMRNSFAANTGMSIQFKTTPALKYGVLFSRCRILPADMANIRNSYFLVPPPMDSYAAQLQTSQTPKKKTQKLHIACRSPQSIVFDRHGRKIGEYDVYEITGFTPDINGNSHVTVPYGATTKAQYTNGPIALIRNSDLSTQLTVQQDSKAILNMKIGDIYHFNLTAVEKGYLALDGFPVIFCPDESTAKAINGSIVTATDGRTFPHRFQKDIYEWMQSLTQQDLEIEPVPLSQFKKEWLADKRGGNLLTTFAYAPHYFKAQDINPASPNFGESPVRISDLTLLYALNRPYNPYYGNPKLMNRVFLYYLKKWLYLTESGAMYDDPGQGAYCGGLEWSGWEGMALYADYITLAMVKPIADPKLCSLLSEALSYTANRFWNHRLTCENQSLHWQMKLLGLYKGTGNPLYLQMEHDTIKDLQNTEYSNAMKTGYFMEAYGLDGTYSGISSCMLAFTTRFFWDDSAIPVLKRFYNLMNHTVVREPDGTLVAANGFGHRTLGTWLSRQYDGGTSYLDDRLPEAAAVSRRAITFTPMTEELFENYAKVSLPEDFDKWCKEKPPVCHYQMDAWVPVWFQSILPIGDIIKEAPLPNEATTDFARNFNNEFFAFRKPNYYAFYYAGNPSWHSNNMQAIKSPLPTSCKFVNGEYYSSGASETWLPMQGLNIFWTQQFGAFILAHNWSMFTQNLVRAERDGNIVDFATCYTGESQVTNNSVILENKSLNLALTMKRKTTMRENGLSVELTVNAPEKIAPVALVEQLPYLLKDDLSFTYFTGNTSLNKPGTGITAVKVTRSNGSEINITFSNPVTLRQGIHSGATFNPENMKSGLLEIVFEPNFDGTKNATLSYEINALNF